MQLDIASVLLIIILNADHKRLLLSPPRTRSLLTIGKTAVANSSDLPILGYWTDQVDLGAGENNCTV